jgi:hypothetical protein
VIDRAFPIVGHFNAANGPRSWGEDCYRQGQSHSPKTSAMRFRRLVPISKVSAMSAKQSAAAG